MIPEDFHAIRETAVIPKALAEEAKSGSKASFEAVHLIRETLVYNVLEEASAYLPSMTSIITVYQRRIKTGQGFDMWEVKAIITNKERQ